MAKWYEGWLCCALLPFVGCGGIEAQPEHAVSKGEPGKHNFNVDPAYQNNDPDVFRIPLEAYEIVPTDPEELDAQPADSAQSALSAPPTPKTYPEVAPLVVLPPATEPYDPEKTPQVPEPGADGIIALTWEPLSAWRYVPDKTPVPARLEQALDGKRVRIVGHLFPVIDTAKPKEFVIMRQGWQCCLLGRQPELNEVIRIVVPEERRQTMPSLLLEVEGEAFEVGEVRDDGFVAEIYTMKLVSLKAAPGG